MARFIKKYRVRWIRFLDPFSPTDPRILDSSATASSLVPRSSRDATASFLSSSSVPEDPSPPPAFFLHPRLCLTRSVSHSSPFSISFPRF
ncbi:hypothetical protein L1887_09350 [Cichorium endivia]|nr:hypothetical protein L1887_09350 [Cichorium endivia]